MNSKNAGGPRSACAVAIFALQLLGCTSMGSGADTAFRNPSAEPVSFGSEGARVNYVILGDSTGAGQGADYEKGIAVQTARALAATRRVTMVNLSVSGARAFNVAAEQAPQAAKLVPNIALISVGANDVTHATPIDSMRDSLMTTVRLLRQANPDVVIVITGAPDMGSPPRIPALLRPLAGRRTDSINRMATALAVELKIGFAAIADETGPLFRADSTLFAADDFHPNERGYATWIAVLNRSLGRALR